MAVAATVHVPESFADAAAVLAAASARGETVKIVGAATKVGWGGELATDLALHTTGLDVIVAHDAGDMTATLQAGVGLAHAQEAFAQAGQMLALDPPLGPAGGEPAATIGGVVATGDAGPLSHRYGAPRDLVVGATVALADGTIAGSGGTVIKNVAGYDVAKLLCGSFGTLGLVLSVNVRLHPLPTRAATVLGDARDPDTLAAAARALAALPAELLALDVRWGEGGGSLLACCAGPEAAPRARRIAEAMRRHGLADVRVSDEDRPVWERQRADQRSADGAVLRVAAAPARLGAVLRAAAGRAARWRGVGPARRARRRPRARRRALGDGPGAGARADARRQGAL